MSTSSMYCLAFATVTALSPCQTCVGAGACSLEESETGAFVALQLHTSSLKSGHAVPSAAHTSAAEIGQALAGGPALEISDFMPGRNQTLIASGSRSGHPADHETLAEGLSLTGRYEGNGSGSLVTKRAHSAAWQQWYPNAHHARPPSAADQYFQPPEPLVALSKILLCATWLGLGLALLRFCVSETLEWQRAGGDGKTSHLAATPSKSEHCTDQGTGASHGPPASVPQRGADEGMPVPVLAFACLFIALVSVSTGQFIPNIPVTAADFGVSEPLILFSVQLQSMAQGCASLVVGPLSDRVGREPVLLGGGLLFCVSTFGCGCAKTIGWFFVFRLSHGIAESTRTVLQAMTRDLVTDASQMARLLMLYQIIDDTCAVLARLGGGVIAAYSNWRYPFYIITGFAAMNAAFGFVVLGENTNAVEARNTNYLRDIGAIFSDPHLVSLMLSCSCLFGILLTNSIDSVVVLEVDYAWGAVPTSIALASFFACGLLGEMCGAFFMRPPFLRFVRLSSAVQLLPGAVMVLATLPPCRNGWMYVLSTCFLQLMTMTPRVAATALYFQPQEKRAGTAAAILNAFQALLGGIIAFLGATFTKSAGPPGLTSFLAGLTVIPVILIYVGFVYPPQWACEVTRDD
mmetsp:Transcript_68469/g.190965  ORF Transcript_68469/g.190965 Transcript_68469/m.190965 type:complete len:632 (+) Transcript_68469:48-1943(+)